MREEAVGFLSRAMILYTWTLCSPNRSPNNPIQLDSSLPSRYPSTSMAQSMSLARGES